LECDATGKRLLTDASGLVEMLNALLVVTDTGKVGLRTVTVSAAAEDISQAVTCSESLMDLEQLLRKMIVESPDGKPAIGLIEES